MKRTVFSILAAALGLVLSAAPRAHAQLNNASAIRGTVLDANGQPLPDVEVELEFKGESRVKIIKKVMTNKKGGYIYSGLPSGNWAFTYRKAGYKTAQLTSFISLGGISEIAPVSLAAGAEAAAANDGSRVAPPTAPDMSTDKAKELADKYTAGLTAIKLGSYAEAETLMNELVAVVPAFAPAHEALAGIYTAQKNNAAAEASYRKVIELSPTEARSYLELANFLAKQSRYDDAFKLLEGAAPQFPQDGVMQFALGAAGFNVSKNEEAEAAFLKAVELNPGNVEPYFYLGSIQVGKGDAQKATEYLQKYVGGAPATAANVPAAKAIIDSLKKK